MTSAAIPSVGLPPLRDAAALVGAMAKVHRTLVADLRERAVDPRVEPSIREAHERDLAEKRTGESYEVYRDSFCDQVGASWVLCAVFARTLEDRGYLPHRLAGPGAADRWAQFRAQFKFLGERDYLLHVFDAIALLPGGAQVFGPAHAPLWRLGPSSRALGELLDALRMTEGDSLRFTFGRPLASASEGANAAGAGPESAPEHDGASTRYLGDLYQDLNEGVRKRYALLQTPEFVERFILEQTLDPAIRERGIAVTVIDPACGSGHFLIGAYDRLFEARREKEPGKPVEESARTALAQIHGVDLNPYAAAIARFRLLLSYLDKAGIRRLEQVSRAVEVRVYVGDALLAGSSEEQITFGDDLARRGEKPLTTGFERGALYSFFDKETDELLGSTRFDVVVANPPYITEKDARKRDLIRERYKDSAAGKYALSAPFAERIFQLANEGGFTGQITSNSFMKREFGKGLIQKVLSRMDLTEVLDTSGAFIPGHGTPTVLLFCRARAPVGSTVRVAMGNRGEPTTPEVPSQGRVWGDIALHHADAGYESEFVSIADMEREKLAQHPWSLGGGGAAELKELLEDRAENRLGDLIESIGFGSFTGADDVFVMSVNGGARRWLEPPVVREMITGDVVRDWAVSPADAALAPYGADANPIVEDPDSRWWRYLWPYRTPLLEIAGFGGRSRRDNQEVWWHWYRWVSERYRTPLSIAFAEVATHNHFVLDRGGKVFKQTAPIIKLPEGATEEEHLALLGYLNSSTACFWMKQVFYPKGTPSKDVDADGGRGENNRYAFAGTGMAQLPLASRSLLAWGQMLDELGTQRGLLCVRSAITHDLSASILRTRIDDIVVEHELLTGRMVALQEELDWATYDSFGLCSPALVGDPYGEGPSISPMHRPFAWGSTAPAALPSALLELYTNRRQVIESNPEIAQLETAVYKRPWLGQQGVFGKNRSTIRERLIADLADWLVERAEEGISEGSDSRPLSVRVLAARLQQALDVRAVAEVLTGTSTFDLEALLGGLLEGEAVASATCQRYTDVGIERRRAWERTWELQRREDAGEKVTIAKPDKYDQKDFENAAVVWRLRGKLDVPKERFIAYPTATPPSGASGKAGLVFGWAGWNHLEQLQAAIELWQEEMGQHAHELVARAVRKDREEALGASAADDEGLGLDQAARDRLMPILQTMVDLLPWVRQWHDEDGETASSFEAYVAAEARKLEVLLEEAHLYRRPKKVAGAKKKPAAKKSAADKPAGEKKKRGKAAPVA